MGTVIYRILLVLAILVPIALSQVTGVLTAPEAAVSLRVGEVLAFVYVALAFVVPAGRIGYMAHVIESKPLKAGDACDTVSGLLSKYDAMPFGTRVFAGAFNVALLILALGAELYTVAVCLVASIAALMLAIGLAERATDKRKTEDSKLRPRRGPASAYGTHRPGA